MRRVTESAKRAAVRREMENESKRLNEVVPALSALKILVSERDRNGGQPEVSHIRHIVVDRAPAMFEFPCSDRHCDGHHDVTGNMLDALKGGETEFEGAHVCGGQSKERACSLELHFAAEAAYAA